MWKNYWEDEAQKEKKICCMNKTDRLSFTWGQPLSLILLMLNKTPWNRKSQKKVEISQVTKKKHIFFLYFCS